MSQSSPPVLLPYQQRWIQDKAQVRVCEKSRRIGLSWAMACEAALYAASADKGQDYWYVGYNQEMAREFVQDCADWARHYNAAAGAIEHVTVVDEDRDILSFRIAFASGWRVTALSSRPTNLRGKQGVVIIDEAAFHDALEELLKAAMALLMWGGRVCVISTHDGVDNAFNELVVQVREGQKPYSLHRITLDDALRDGLYRRICLKLKLDWSQASEDAWRQELIAFYGEAAQEELFCVPRGAGGAYLNRSSIVQCQKVERVVRRVRCPDGFEQQSDDARSSWMSAWLEENLRDLLEALDKDLQSYYGSDFARSGDLSVVFPLQRKGGLLVAPFVLEMRNVPFRQQEQALFYLVDHLPRFDGGLMDAGGNGAYLAEVAAQRYGSRVAGVQITNTWYSEHMPILKAALEDRGLELPADPDLLADLRSIEMVQGIPKVGTRRTKGSDGLPRHGDAAIALVMAVAAASNPATPIEFQSLNRPRVARELKSYLLE